MKTMSTMGTMGTTSTAACLGIVAALGLAACTGPADSMAFGELSPALVSGEGGKPCIEPGAGCACAANQPPVPCAPDGALDLLAATQARAGETLCYEGTRRCIDGVFGACEDVRAFVVESAQSQQALVDTVSAHPQCSDCDRSCFFVRDDLSSDDGELTAGIADGLAYHGSGAGITLEAQLPSMGSSDAGIPDGALLIEVDEGLTGSASHEHVHHPEAADVYFLVDRSLTMADEGQWLFDHYAGGASYGDATRSCADDDATAIGLGVTGAVRCMVRAPRFGAGMFRDIPFSPYSSDQVLPDPQRETDARQELAYRHYVDFVSEPSAAQGLGGLESSGNPDRAGSQVAALYSIATGDGLFTGIGRVSVPDGPSCASGAGYPCFDDDADRIVVLVTDAPMHNGPDPSSLPYDYDPVDLTTLIGTTPTTTLAPDNDDWPDAPLLSSDAGNELSMFLGTTTGLSANVEADVLRCGADDGSPDAVFAFDVVASGGPGTTVDVTLSADGTSFPSTIALFDGPVLATEMLPSAADDNELFTSAHALGDLSGRHVRIAGDTGGMPTSMQADYQGSLFGAACGANSIAADAVYAFNVSSASATVPLELTLDMDGAHPVLAVYDSTAGPLPRWPAQDSPLLASGNTNALPINVFTIPSGPTDSYVSVAGSTALLDSDYSAVDLGGASCGPSDDSKDAAFRIHVEGTKRLRFDTEGSSFDTVLSLHNRPPLTQSGSVLRFTAADTHQNMNEHGEGAYETGVINGLTQIFEGDTTGMDSDMTDTFGCGLDDACGDAVYEIEVMERTTVRLEVSGTGYEPAVVVTRSNPVGVSGRYAPVATGRAHTCALSNGEVYCWGDNASGQLGDGTTTASGSAVRAGTLTDVVHVCTGASHSCAVNATGEVYCWGESDDGRLGSEPGSDALSPIAVPGLGEAAVFGRAVQVACGDRFTCALHEDGVAMCFGDNSHGELGDGTTTPRAMLADVSGSQRFEQLDAGARHVCAVRASDNAVYCWGEGQYGKLGDGAISDNLAPARVATLTDISHVMAGGDHTCAVQSSGRVVCWGRNQLGQLGQGAIDSSDHSSPVEVRNEDGSGSLANVASGFAAGGSHTCVLQLSGRVRCWGDNTDRQLGNGSGSTPVTLPTAVTNVLDAVHVVSGYEHSCVLRANGELACFGQNGDGQLGDGTSVTPSTPVQAQPGGSGNAVAFGTGTLDVGLTSACRSLAQAPEAGCDFAQLGGRAYSVCDTASRTWLGAKQACESVGMQLVDVDDNGENAALAAQIASGERAWIGVKRESSADWLELTDDLDFENLAGDRVWHTYATERCASYFWGWCTSYEEHVQGYFTSAADPDLVDSSPIWTSSSTWASRTHPSTAAGSNCVTLSPSAKWRAEDCAGTEEPEPFSGGVEHGYVCEERDRVSELTLDPGRYYVTVKGMQDGSTGNACEGPYELRLTDLGTPGGGFLTCDDDGVSESQSSVIEATLTEGDYYLILKGKAAGDQGNYQLTVRDVDAVATTELACDGGTGSGDPARVHIDAEPGRTYYALVKGDAPLDQGPFTLRVRDDSPGTGQFLGCDESSSPAGDPELSVPLETGSYYAVLKGTTPTASGPYQFMLGSADPVSSTFEPPSYDDTIAALRAEGIRVASVLSCVGQPDCDDARAQLSELASDTNGVLREAASAADVPLEVVRAVEQLERADSVRAEVVFSPDANPGFIAVTTLPIPEPDNHCTGFDSTQFTDCAPGASPSFLVSLHNPALAPVPVGPPPLDAYELTLRVTSERDGEVISVRDEPLYVRSSGSPPPGTYGTGSYHQDIDARGCVAGGGENLRPSWDELRFDADVRPDTVLTFSACTSDDEDALASCDDATFERVLTVTAGTGAGDSCTVTTQSTDCPDGYCSPYTGICNYLEGASCMQDIDCPGDEDDRCRSGPSAATLGDTCRVIDGVGSPASALDAGNLRSFLRLQVDLEALGDGSRTPSLFFFEAWYRCRMTE